VTWFLSFCRLSRDHRGLMASGEAGQDSPCTPKGRAKRKDGAGRCKGWIVLQGKPKEGRDGATNFSGMGEIGTTPCKRPSGDQTTLSGNPFTMGNIAAGQKIGACSGKPQQHRSPTYQREHGGWGAPQKSF
jgi:hypothetical protein